MIKDIKTLMKNASAQQLFNVLEIALDTLAQNDYIICNDINHKELMLDVIQAREDTEAAMKKIHDSLAPASEG